MTFEELLERVSPRLRRLARQFDERSLFLGSDDLYQEMVIHLWNQFQEGTLRQEEESYIVKGCEFHLRNCLRKARAHRTILSLEEPLDDEGNTLKEILPARGRPIHRFLEEQLTVEEILSNGYPKRVKEVLLLLIQGYTTREIGQKLKLSHVRVVKLKQELIQRYQGKRE